MRLELLGDVSLYELPDYVAVSFRQEWISALFVDREAALSWIGDLPLAERQFAEVNSGRQVRDVYLRRR